MMIHYRLQNTKKTSNFFENFSRIVRHFGVVSFANKSHPLKEREENTPFPTPQPLDEYTHTPPLRNHLLQYEPHELTWKRGPNDTRPFSKEGIFLIDFLTCGEKRPPCVGAALFSYLLYICMYGFGAWVLNYYPANVNSKVFCIFKILYVDLYESKIKCTLCYQLKFLS